jgi:hypothetical protein
MYNESDSKTLPEVLKGLILTPFRLRTYTNLLYLILAFPLGLAYFIFLAVGLTTGVALTLIWIGIPILAVVFAGVWGLAAFERQAAIHLLGAQVPPMLPPPSPEQRTIWQQARDFLANPVTWKGMVFLLLKLPLGIVSFVMLVATLALSGSLLLSPVLWQWGAFDIDGFLMTLGPWEVDTFQETWICALFGLGLLYLSLILLNGLALVWRAAATALLGSPRFDAAAPPPAEMPDAMALA